MPKPIGEMTKKEMEVEMAEAHQRLAYGALTYDEMQRISTVHMAWRQMAAIQGELARFGP